MQGRSNWDDYRRESERRNLRRRQIQLWVLCTLAAVLSVGVIYAMLVTGTRREPKDGHPPPSPSASYLPADQARFQARIVDDRKGLFAGRLICRSSISTSVDDSIIYRVTLVALGEKDVNGPRGARPAIETRKFQVGGVEGASLTSTSSEVKVRLLADTATEQVIAAPGDAAHWQWTVTPSESGDYDLVLVLTTYQGDSDRALATLTPPITVHLVASNTLSHQVSSMQNTLITLGGVAMAVTTLFAFRAPLLSVTRARKEARREKKKRGRDGYM
ncbi:hypothetical protein [Streptomyces sp. SAS_270]|uniref:hypothetical protein n=1 Tax=Streptomyces sp. SAS_270 TaxID=3412748 RepID=UPI00403CCBDD